MSALDANSAPAPAPSPLRWPLLRFWRLLDAPLQAAAGGGLSLRHQCFFLRLEHALAVAQYVRQASALGRTVSRRNLEAFYLDENLTARYPFPAERLSIGSIQENGQRLAKGLRAILGSDLPQFEFAHQGLRRAEALSAEEWVRALEQSLAQARPSFEAATNPSVLIQRLVNEARKCGVLNCPSLFQTSSDGLVRGGVWICGWTKKALASGRVERSRKSPAVSYRPLIWTFSVIVLAVSIWWTWPRPHVPTRAPATTTTSLPAVAVAPISPPPRPENQPERTNHSARAESVPSPAPVVQVGPKVSEGPQPAESKSKPVATEQVQHLEKAQKPEEARKAQEQAQKIEEARKSAEADMARQAEASKQAARNADLAARTKVIDSVNPAELKNLADHDDADAAVKLGRLYEMGSSTFSVDENTVLSQFAKRLNRHSDPVSEYLYQGLPDWQQSLLMKWGPSAPFPGDAHSLVVHALNKIIGAPCIYEAERFKGVVLRPETIDLLKQKPKDSGLARLNRLLLEDAYPEELRMHQEPAAGITRDYAEAVKWYRKAAEAGNSDGQFNLGRMYGFGLGVQNDFGKALNWFRKAAEAGNAGGQTFLGFMYQNGIGVETNFSEFLKWIHKAESNPKLLPNRFDLREELRELEAQARQAKANRQAAQNAEAAERKRMLDSNDTVASKIREMSEAARDGDLVRVEALLKENPNLVFSKDAIHGDTPLALAAQMGHKDVADLLLANRADVNARNKYDMTPLHVAAFNGFEDIARLLLAYNADVNLKDNNGMTPLHLTMHGDDRPIPTEGSLIYMHLRVNDAKWAFNHGNKKVAQLLIASKADVNAKEANGMTPLHFAALCGNKEGAELLLAGKAEVNGKNDSGHTPLDEAVAAGNSAVAELLRQHGGQASTLKTSGGAAVLAVVNKAEQGDAQAQLKIAGMYFTGTTVEKDLTKAVKWYKAAAEAGNPEAQYDLGAIYEYGLCGLKIDLTEAGKWYRQAAEGGNSEGQKKLARLLAH